MSFLALKSKKGHTEQYLYLNDLFQYTSDFIAILYSMNIHLFHHRYTSLASILPKEPVCTPKTVPKEPVEPAEPLIIVFAPPK